MALDFWIAFSVCFCVTCTISCASTSASSASFLMRASAPRVMCTKPPGAANALTPSVSSTTKVHLSFGRLLADAEHRSDERHVLVDRGVLHDAVLVANLRADLAADLLFFRVGEGQILTDFGGLVDDLAEVTELRARRRRDQHMPRSVPPGWF